MAKNKPQIEVVDIADIVPDTANANKGTPRGQLFLEASLQKHGAGRSILLDRNRRIIAGNKTHAEAGAVGLSEVIVVRTRGDQLVAVQREDLDLDDDDTGARLLAYRDNRTSEVSLNWDAKQLLADLDAGVDLSEMFQSFELNQLLEGEMPAPPEDPGPQIDRAAELREKWGVEVGQVWQLGEHRVVCGDCTDPAVVEAVMQGEKAEMGLTSPPYAVGKEYEEGVSFAEHLALLRGVADQALEIIEPGGFFVINFDEIAAQSHTKPLTGSDRQCLYPISKDYWQIFHDERNMDLYAQRIWYKPFNRLQQPFWTYKTSIPHYQEWEHIWTWRLPGGEGDVCYDWEISSRAIWDTRKEATDDRPLTRHVAAFPVGIPERILKAHSGRDAIIWEPFLGSGTTLIACEQLGRRARGIEIEPGYVAVTLERWQQATGRQPQLC